MSTVGLTILKDLRGKNSKTRLATLKSLADKPLDDKLKRAVIGIFREDRRGVNRIQALTVLAGVWPDPKVVSAFSEALEGELFLAEKAVALLGEIADHKAFDLLEQVFVATRNVWVKIRVLGVFHRAPQNRILVFLKRTRALNCPEDNIRATTVSMLARVKNPTLSGIFATMLEDRNDRVRANAVEALGKCLTGLTLARSVLPLAVDKNNRVRANALVILLKLGVKKVERCLLDMAGHANALFRASAAFTLGEIPFAAPRRELLNKLLQDDDEMVVNQAERALEKQLVLA